MAKSSALQLSAANPENIRARGLSRRANRKCLVRLNESRHIEHVLFHMQSPIQREASRAASASFGTKTLGEPLTER
jgi:hypothetical protein